MDAHRLPNGQVHDSASSPESKYNGGPIQEHKEKVEKANPITYITAKPRHFWLHTATRIRSSRITKACCWKQPSNPSVSRSPSTRSKELGTAVRMQPQAK